MGFLVNGLRSYLLSEKSLRDPTLNLYFGGGPTASGANVTEWTALNYAAFWGAVNIISNSVATLPLVLYRRLPDGGREPFVDHPLYRLLHDDFSPETTSIKARQTMQGHVLTWGNAYAEIERDVSDRPLALHVLTPDRVVPDRDTSGAIIYRVNSTKGIERRIPGADMLHLAGPGFDPLVGYSVIRKAREELGIGVAAQTFGAHFFGNGATAGLVAMHPGSLTPNATANIKKSIQDAIGGDKKHSVLVLEEGMKVEKTTIPPDDAQFIETFRMTTLWICQRFNLPPHKLAELERATFSNIEHQAIEYVQDCLMPWLVIWEHECNRKLVRPLERRSQYVKHSVDALLRGDSLSRAQALEIRRRNGTLNADEWRDLEDENPLPNGQGKVYIVQSNNVPLDRLDEVINAQTAPARAPAALPPQPAPQPKPRSENFGDILAGNRQVIVAELERLGRRETQAACRAVKKGPEGLRVWEGDFYPKHAAIMRDCLLPSMQVHLACVAATTGAQGFTAQLVEDYITQSRAELAALPADEMENAFDRMMSRWEAQRPAQVADALMTEEIGHVIGQ